MTEQEWLECTDPTAMVEFLYGQSRSSDRKLRLFAVASCRTVWSNFPDDQCRQTVNAAELFADGLIEENELTLKAVGALRATEGGAWASVAAATAVLSVTVPILQGSAPYLHDIFGNPFRPITIDPRWQTSTVVDLANAIYQEKAFERMPILADALAEGGCDHEEIIHHCRGNGPHVRGCWVVDLLLGKE